VIPLRLVVPLDDPAPFILRIPFHVEHLAALAIDDLVVAAVFLKLPLLALGPIVLGQDGLGPGVVRVVGHGQYLAGVRVDEFDVLASLRRGRSGKQPADNYGGPNGFQHARPPWKKKTTPTGSD